MRDYGAISPRFWIGATGKALRGHLEAQLVACYLMSAPGSHMIGLYTLAIPTLCHETGLSQEGATKGLARLSEVGFAYYDADEEVVWVPEMARFQIGESLGIGPKGADKRILGVERELENFRKSRFFNDFLDKYARAFSLKIKRESASPLQGPSKPQGSQEQDQDQGQDQEHDQRDLRSGTPPAPAAPDSGGEKLQLSSQEPLIPAGPLSPLLEYLAQEFPTANADSALEKAWQESCPSIDLLAEAKRARAWELSNPKRVAKMKRAFLRSWFDREHEKQRKLMPPNSPAPPVGQRRGFVPLTGTSERFKDYDDGDPLGLGTLKPKKEISNG